MKGYKGYFIKISGVEFNDPHPKKDTFRYAPELVQVGKSEVTANGRLSTKVLPHARRKIWVEFPPLNERQYKKYWRALHNDSTGKGMKLTVEVYNSLTGDYDVDTFYHNDLEVTYAFYGGEMKYLINAFDLIGW